MTAASRRNRSTGRLARRCDLAEREAAQDAETIQTRFSTPRQVAGGPKANDNVACQLRPLDRADYGTFLAFDDPDGNSWLVQEVGRTKD